MNKNELDFVRGMNLDTWNRVTPDQYTQLCNIVRGYLQIDNNFHLRVAPFDNGGFFNVYNGESQQATYSVDFRDNNIPIVRDVPIPPPLIRTIGINYQDN